MAIQIVLTLALLVAFLYALSQRAQLRMMFALLSLGIASAIFFVWNPDAANRVAHMFGVGRGADLVLYFFVVLSFVVGFNLHIKNNKNRQYVTELARELALLRAQYPEDPPNAHGQLNTSAGK